MIKRALLVLAAMPALLLAPLGVGAATAQAQAAQPRTVTGRVTSEQGDPMGSVSVIIKGTSQGTMTRVDGNYTVRVAVGQILVFRLIGNAPEERTVGANDVINVTLRRVATQLDAMVVTALGQTAQVRTLGTSQQSVEGAAISETQRQNFVNALQGRVAGVEVTSSSGVPGASSS
ncbi:MAG: carboxypeptidase-like regulatory domain-containing protein, partial [Gemmatimonadaceae bacterium]|nr:carboxypeptidase-like regulatory domain-containing protein [Gemmatimonadaceae bacterium]